MNGTAGDAPSLAEQIADLLARGRVACLATLVQNPNEPAGVGAKLLVEPTGERHGTLGDEVFDGLVAARARKFLASRAEAATLDSADLFNTGDFIHGL